VANIPYHTEENTTKIIANIIFHLCIDIPVSSFACFRALNKTKDNTDKNNPPLIIVKFATNHQKNLFKKRPMEDLRLSHLATIEIPGVEGLDLNRPIYIKESLTKEQSHLFYLARKFKKEHGYRFVWTRDGQIYLRKQEEQPVHEIRHEADLTNLANPTGNSQDEYKANNAQQNNAVMPAQSKQAKVAEKMQKDGEAAVAAIRQQEKQAKPQEKDPKKPEKEPNSNSGNSNSSSSSSNNSNNSSNSNSDLNMEEEN
jgi:hypothetical protein